MLALLKKNLRHQWSLAPSFMIALSLVVALVDISAEHPAPVGLLYTVCFFTGVVAAIVCFNVDQQNDSTRFLSYLPVKRSHVWLANYGLSLAFGLAATLVLLLPRVFFRPSSEFLKFEDHPHVTLYAGPILMFVTFSAGAFFRAAAKRLAASLLLACLALIILPIVLVALLEATDFSPYVTELAPVFAFAGACFSLAGFLVFVITPPAVEPRAQKLRVVSIYVLSLGLIGGVAFVQALDWRKLDRNEEMNVERVYPIEGDASHLLAQVSTKRSHGHLIRIDLAQPKNYLELGRQLELARAVGDPYGDNELRHNVQNTQKVHALDGGTRIPLVRTKDRFELFDSKKTMAMVSFDGTKPERSVVIPNTSWWSAQLLYADDELAIFPGLENTLIVTDPNGAVLHRFAETQVSHVGSTGRILATKSGTRDAEVIDPRAGTRVDIADRVLATDPKLEKIAVERISGDNRRTVMIRDLIKNREEVVLTEKDTALLFDLPAESQAPRYGLARRVLSPPISFDAELECAVFIPREIDGSEVSTSIHFIDLKKHEKKELVPSSALSKKAIIKSFSSPPVVFGLTCDAVVVELDGSLEHIDIATGARTVMIDGVSPNDELAFSPSLERGVRREPNGMRVYERSGESELLPTERDGNHSFTWLDDERLLVNEWTNLWLFQRVQGKMQRTIILP